MRYALRFLASCIFCLPLLARPAALPGDLTGIWFDSHHPGWGLGLLQQNDTIFATLFTYDSSGAPSWNVATLKLALVPSIPIAHDLCATIELSGPLYGTQWPSFGSVANPQGSVQVQAVGTMVVLVPTALLNSGCDGNTVNIQYSIGGAQVATAVTRETWSSNQARLYGQFAGGLVFFPPASSCPDLNDYPTLPPVNQQMTIGGSADSSNPSGVLLGWSTGIDTVCQITGAYSQGGQLGALTGTFACGPINFGPPPSMGPIRLSSLSVSDSGFAADVALDVGSCHYLGAIAGARHP